MLEPIGMIKGKACMDQIIIENLQVYAYHGVYREENEKGQNFYINAIKEMDTRKSCFLDYL